MLKSASTRSIWFAEKRLIASCPFEAETTLYPFVESMNLSTDSSCSLSSTQRITFLGRMVWGSAPCFVSRALVLTLRGFATRRQYDSSPLLKERAREAFSVAVNSRSKQAG